MSQAKQGTESLVWLGKSFKGFGRHRAWGSCSPVELGGEAFRLCHLPVTQTVFAHAWTVSADGGDCP